MQWQSPAITAIAIIAMFVKATSCIHIPRIKDGYYSVESLRMIIVGDIGGLPVYPYYTYAQSRVADIMEDWAFRKKVQCVITLGDNIYYVGVRDEQDSRFKICTDNLKLPIGYIMDALSQEERWLRFETGGEFDFFNPKINDLFLAWKKANISKQNTFENIYNGKGLDVPWYMIAGNHDYLGNISAQLSYSNYSHKWHFPGLYYKLSFPLTKACVEILMIDTIVLCGSVATIHKDQKFRERAERQWRWIEENLKSSKADYLFVAGHYPIHSTASHGPTTCLRKRLDPLLWRYHVSAYFSGHDHTLQHIAYPIGDGYEMHYVVSGAGSRSDHSTKHLGTIPAQFLMFHYPVGWNPISNWGFTYGGFLYMEITKNSASLQFITGSNVTIYRTNIYPRSMRERWSTFKQQSCISPANEWRKRYH